MYSNVKELPAKLEYPKLMKCTALGKLIIVLFDACGRGTVLKSDCHHSPLGAYKTSWDMIQFQDFDGVIELSNRGV